MDDALNSRRCRVGLVDVTLPGDGTPVTGTWKRPGTIESATPSQIELERAPVMVRAWRTVAGAVPAEVTIAATATGVTVTPSAAGDTGTLRIEGVVEAG
jgi:hypothetical protein